MKNRDTKIDKWGGGGGRIYEFENFHFSSWPRSKFNLSPCTAALLINIDLFIYVHRLNLYEHVMYDQTVHFHVSYASKLL